MPINNRTHQLTVTAEHVTDAYEEALNRQPFTVNKNGDGNAKHVERLARGFVPQNAVTAYFEERWPWYVLPPSNHRQWDRMAPDDFQISVQWSTKPYWCKVFDVDVAGHNRPPPSVQRERGQIGWGSVPRKPAADIHIMVSSGWPKSDVVTIHGWSPGDWFKSEWMTEDKLLPFHRLERWLDFGARHPGPLPAGDYHSEWKRIYEKALRSVAT